MPYRFNFHTKKLDYYERSVDVTTTGLVLAMNFNPETLIGTAGSEKVLDSSGYGNHGQNYGATAISTGGFNNGGFLSFDGVDDYIDLGNVLNFGTQPFTIAVWIYPTNAAKVNNSIISKGNANFPSGWYLWVGGVAHRLGFTTNGTTRVSIDNVIANNQWFHVVLTRTSDGILTLYVDSIQRSTGICPNDFTNNLFFIIGDASWYLTEGFGFQGSIDEPRIYNRAITADEVKQLYLQRKEIHNFFVSQKNMYAVCVSTQFNKTADTTLEDIPGLSVNLVAGKRYKFTVNLFVNADAIGGHKYAMSGTVTAGSIIYQINSISNTTNLNVINSRQTVLGGPAGQAGATVIHTVIEGFINLGDGGILTCQFAQNVASGTSSVLVNSNMIVEQIS